MTKDLLPAVILFIFQGLQDEDDDVRAVAAAALVPVADDLVVTMPQLVRIILELYTVKPVLSDHSKIQNGHQKSVFMTEYRLVQVKIIAECSKGSILQYF